MPIATPPPANLATSNCIGSPPSAGVKVMVAVRVTADDDRLGTAGYQPWHVGHDDRLAEDDPAQDVPDRAVGRAPHLLQAELRDTRLVGGDRRAFDADAVALDGVGRVDRDLVRGLVATLDRQVVVLQLDVEVRLDQLLPDLLPDDPGHLVAVVLDDRVPYLDLGHRPGAPLGCQTVRAYWLARRDAHHTRLTRSGSRLAHQHRLVQVG